VILQVLVDSVLRDPDDVRAGVGPLVVAVVVADLDLVLAMTERSASVGTCVDDSKRRQHSQR
jgi:hypothetical protein